VAALPERMIAALREHPRGLDDEELAAELRVMRQAINHACRNLASAGRLTRVVEPGGRIVNSVVVRGAPPTRRAVRVPTGLLHKDQVKHAVKAHLEAEGYAVTVASGRGRGIDIEAIRSDPPDHLLLDAKGEDSLGTQRTIEFVGALGELIQRMAHTDARYGLALPDNPHYRGLVAALPGPAWDRLGFVALFVRRGRTNHIYEVDIVTGV
jgi:hypothetical protein